jgi:flagellar motor switch protein FliN/FliY
MNSASRDSHPDSNVQPAGTLAAFHFIGDLPVTLVAELDRRSIRFEELVRLEAGTVVALTRPAGENIDVLVGDVLLGSGEILVIDNSLAIRIAELRDKPVLPPAAVEMFDEDSAAA